MMPYIYNSSDSTQRENMTPDYWHQATKQLSKQCPTMGSIIARYDRSDTLKARSDAFYTLIRAIAGQQISVKAADAVWAKLAKAVKPMTPKNLLKKTDEELRTCGFSKQKVLYARNVAEFFVDRKVTPQYWAKRTDEEIIAELVSIKGIGSWTAEMFLIFHLTRPNILPLKDLGLLKAIDLHYHKGKRKKNKQYHELGKRWEPYRTVATWYLWRALDPVPVEY